MVSEEATAGTTVSVKSNESTQAPVQLLKKKGKNEASTRAPSRQQKRDATPMPKLLVDLDVNSPELVIMDDYVEKAGGSEQTIQPQRQVKLESGGQLFNKNVCFSPVAMVSIC